MKTIGKEFLSELSGKAAASPRRRANFNLHKSLDEGIHRLCVAAMPDTYIRPHRHTDKWELLVILKGAADVLIFDEAGSLKDRVTISEAGDDRAIEIDEGVFHGFIPHGGGSVILEVKRGPYAPIPEADFAPWSPAEGDAKAQGFLARLKGLKTGGRIP